MKRTAIFLTMIILIGTLFTGCNAITKKDTSSNTPQEFDLTTPEKTIDVYINTQVALASNDLDKLFYNQKINEGFKTKLIQSCYKQKLTKLVKVINVVKKDNFAVAVCLYESKYGTIKESLQAINAFQFINKDDNWYIMNDTTTLKPEERKWLQDTADSEYKKAIAMSDYKDIEAKQTAYYSQHQDFMKVAQEALASEIEQNADKLKEVKE